MTSLKSKRLRLLGFRMIAVLDMAYSSPKASAICVTALPTDPPIAGASTVLLALKRAQVKPPCQLIATSSYRTDLKLTRRLCLHYRYFGVVTAVETQFAEWTKPNDALRRL